MSRWVAWDLETSGLWPQGQPPPFGNIGISCASTWTSDGDLTFWRPIISKEVYEDRMKPEQVDYLCAYLSGLHRMGYTVVTFNGAGFDFRVLSTECSDSNWKWSLECARIALDHVDIALQMYTEKGYMISLNAMSEALGLAGKTEGMSGSLAPILWNGMPEDASDELKESIKGLGVEPGSRQAQNLCLEYVGQDSKATADVYLALLKKPIVKWINAKGMRVSNRTAWSVPELRPVQEIVNVSDSDWQSLTGWMDRQAEHPRQKLEWAYEILG